MFTLKLSAIQIQLIHTYKFKFTKPVLKLLKYKIDGENYYYT